MATGTTLAGDGLLITGFTGFLGKHLAAELLVRRPGLHILALVRSASTGRAGQLVEALERDVPGARDRIRLLVGDIALPHLGLTTPEEVADQVGELFHLAALYDLAAPADLAERANIEGTRRLLDFASLCPHLRRLHYFSTCYVAGTHRGVFHEDDLELGQGFLNHYDRTKFAAETLVRQRAGELPITIYRPAIIVGNSCNGATSKFDGPYFAMNAMRRLPRRFLFPRIGSGQAPVNLVPVDFVIRATAHLAGLKESLSQCYHLVDPAPLSALDLQRVLMEELDRRFLLVPVSCRVARLLLKPNPIQRYLGLPVHALPYFDYPVLFDTSRTDAHLAGSGIACPPLRTYLPSLVRYWQTLQ